MGEPQYRLEGIVRTRSDAMEDFEGPLDVIFLLLTKYRTHELLVRDTGPEQFFYLPSGNAPYHG